MRARLVLLVCGLPLLASAQLQLSLFDGSKESPMTAFTELGSVAAGDAREIRIHLRNAGSAAIVLSTVEVRGQGFAISSAPSLGTIIAPENFKEARVRFTAAGTGSYSAVFKANEVEATLHAIVVSGPTVSILADSVGSLLTSGATLDFGRVQKGHSSAQDLRVANGGSSPITIQSCGLTGDSGFHAAGLACPMTLAAGSAVTVHLSFDPQTAGQQNGTVAFDGRSFALSGVAFDPPLPQPSIAFSAPLSSGVQQKLAIALASKAESSGSGTVTMEFQPVEGASDDPAVQFTRTGSRKLSFQVNEGDSAGQFPSGIDSTFQTGTTAGTMIFHVKLGDYDEQYSFPIAKAAVYVDQATGSRRVNDLDVSITGYDNTRTAGRCSFTFYDRAGKLIQAGIGADWTQLFLTYYKTSKTGGSFLLRATFPVSGDATQIGGVEVEMTNSAGVTRTTRVGF